MEHDSNATVKHGRRGTTTVWGTELTNRAARPDNQTHRLDTPPGNPLSLGSRLAEVSASTSANAEPGAGSGEQHGQAGPREEE